MVFGAFIDKTLFVCIETFGLLEEEFSMTDIKPFYITILLQAINNMYDAGCSIAKKKQVFQVNLLQGITFLLIESKEYYAQFPFRVDFLGYWEFTIDNDLNY
jgi:hypothetical protein